VTLSAVTRPSTYNKSNRDYNNSQQHNNYNRDYNNYRNYGNSNNQNNYHQNNSNHHYRAYNNNLNNSNNSTNQNLNNTNNLQNTGTLGANRPLEPLETSNKTTLSNTNVVAGQSSVLIDQQLINQSNNPSSTSSSNDKLFTKWVPPSVINRTENLTEEDRNNIVFRKVRGILNKITPDKFNKLSDELLQCELDSPAILKGVVVLIFNKALEEPKYSSMYAQLCRKISEGVKNFEYENPGYVKSGIHDNTFCKYLLAKCQHEFNNRCQASEAFGDGPFTEEEEEKRDQAKKMMLGNIKFICELGKQNLADEGILHRCIVQLCKKKNNMKHTVEDFECLCQIMKTVGRLLDTERGKSLMDQYFSRMEKYANMQNELPLRIKFKIQDVLDLRKNKWVPRNLNIDQNPKTLGQIREEATKDYSFLQPGGTLMGNFSMSSNQFGNNNAPFNVRGSSNYGQQQNSFQVTGQRALDDLYGANIPPSFGTGTNPNSNSNNSSFDKYEQQNNTVSNSNSSNNSSSNYQPQPRKIIPQQPAFISNNQNNNQNNNNSNNPPRHMNNQNIINNKMSDFNQQPNYNNNLSSSSSNSSSLRDDEQMNNQRNYNRNINYNNHDSRPNQPNRFNNNYQNNPNNNYQNNYHQNRNNSGDRNLNKDNNYNNNFQNNNLNNKMGNLNLRDQNVNRNIANEPARQLPPRFQKMQQQQQQHNVPPPMQQRQNHYNNYQNNSNYQNNQYNNQPIMNQNNNRYNNNNQYNNQQQPNMNQYNNNNQQQNIPPQNQKLNSVPNFNAMDSKEISLRPVKNFFVPKSLGTPPSMSAANRNDQNDSQLNQDNMNRNMNRPQFENKSTMKQQFDGKPFERSAVVKEDQKEDYMKKVTEILNKFIEKEIDEKESLNRIKNLKSSKVNNSQLLVHIMKFGLDKSEQEREQITKFISKFKEENFCSVDDYIAAFKQILSAMRDLEVDVPKIKSFVAVYIARGLADEIIDLKEAFDLTDKAIYYPLFLLCLQYLGQTEDQSWLIKKFNDSKIDLMQALPEIDRNKDRLSEMLRDRQLGFLYPLLRIESELMKQVNSGNDISPKSLYTWIKENVDSNLQKSEGFIITLFTCLAKYVTEKTKTSIAEIEEEGSNTEKRIIKLQKEVLSKYAQIFQSFLLDQPNLQLALLYALQTYCHKLSFPKGMIFRWFIMLYDLEIVDSDVFLKWKEEVNDDYPDKGKALFQVNTWLTWLEKAEQDDEEEDDE